MGIVGPLNILFNASVLITSIIGQGILVFLLSFTPGGFIFTYIKFCFYISIIIVIFMIGGVFMPIIGVGYCLYIFFNMCKCRLKNIPLDNCDF